MPGKAYASIKDPVLYEKLRAQGYTKQAAAAISNAEYNRRRRK
jgi:hypothetical protein